MQFSQIQSIYNNMYSAPAQSSFPYCLGGLSGLIPAFSEELNHDNSSFGANDACKSSHDSTSQGSYCNKSFCKIIDKNSLNSQCMELNKENSQIGYEKQCNTESSSSKSFITIREVKITPTISQDKNQNVSSEKGIKQKSKRKAANKAKIPQNLIENRKQEILTSLEKVSDASKEVIQAVPRISTGSKRGSNYRGVSVNGKKWQVMVMGFGKKRYYGGIKDQQEAARLYDKYAILTQGVGAKTNFSYTKEQVLCILNENLKFE